MINKKMTKLCFIVFLLLMVIPTVFAQEDNFDWDTGIFTVGLKVYHITGNSLLFETELGDNSIHLKCLSPIGAELSIDKKVYKFSENTEIYLKEDKVEFIITNEFISQDKKINLRGFNNNTLSLKANLSDFDYNQNNQFVSLSSLVLNRIVDNNKKEWINGTIVCGKNETIQLVNGINITLDENGTLRIVNNEPKISGNSYIIINGIKITNPSSSLMNMNYILDKNQKKVLSLSGDDFLVGAKRFSGKINLENPSYFTIVDGSYIDTVDGTGVEGKNVLVSYGKDISLLQGNVLSILPDDAGTLYKAKGSMKFQTFQIKCDLKKGEAQIIDEEKKSSIIFSGDAVAELNGVQVDRGISLVNKNLFLETFNTKEIYMSQGKNYLEYNSKGDISISSGSSSGKAMVLQPESFEENFIEPDDNSIKDMTQEQRQQCAARVDETEKIIDESSSSSDPEQYMISHFSLTGSAIGDFEQSSFAQSDVTNFHYSGSSYNTPDPLSEGLRNFVGETCKGFVRKSLPYAILAERYPQLRYNEEKVLYKILQSGLSQEEQIDAIVQAVQNGEGDLDKQDILEICKSRSGVPFTSSTDQPSSLSPETKMWFETCKRIGISQEEIAKANQDDMLNSVMGMTGSLNIVGGAAKTATGASSGFFRNLFKGGVKNNIDDAAVAASRIGRAASQVSSLSDDIARATSLDEVKLAVQNAGGITGSRFTYTPEEVSGLIDDVVAGRADANVLTRTAGLRQKVLNLPKTSPKVRIVQRVYKAGGGSGQNVYIDDAAISAPYTQGTPYQKMERVFYDTRQQMTANSPQATGNDWGDIMLAGRDKLYADNANLVPLSQSMESGYAMCREASIKAHLDLASNGIASEQYVVQIMEKGATKSGRHAFSVVKTTAGDYIIDPAYNYFGPYSGTPYQILQVHQRNVLAVPAH